jgi:hypothetical protein
MTELVPQIADACPLGLRDFNHILKIHVIALFFPWPPDSGSFNQVITGKGGKERGIFNYNLAGIRATINV